jgi:enolase
MTYISDVKAWEALDSRGRPTVACRVLLRSGVSGSALVPSGASAGSHEALELRDHEARYGGRGVRRAVEHVNTVLAKAVHGLDVVSGLDEVEAALADADTSAGFSHLGANAVLAVSLASAIAAANNRGTSLARYLDPTGPLLLPMPMVNVISGGAHAGNVIDIQDFLVIPLGAESVSQAIEWSVAVREATRDLALARGFGQAVLVADEGGLGLPLASNRDALELLTAGISAAGLTPGAQAGIAIDVAASEFYSEGKYHLARDNRTLDSAELIAEIASWCADFPVASVEDALAEDDWDGWTQITALLGDRVQLIGDDLFVTNPERLSRGITERAANGVLVKVNQNGLMSGAGAVVAAARAADFRTIVSARSGDTEDSWLADLAVGWRAGQIKVGSTHRSERTAKWNRLLELEALENTTFAHPWS